MSFYLGVDVSKATLDSACTYDSTAKRVTKLFL